MNAAQSVREKKMLRPNDFCLHPLCLWRTRTLGEYTPCPRHPEPNGVVSRLLGVRELPERSDSALDAPTAPVLPLMRCPVCSGVGTVRVSREGRIVTRADCGECRGTGRVPAPTLRQMAERQRAEYDRTGRVTIVGDEETR